MRTILGPKRTRLLLAIALTVLFAEITYLRRITDPPFFWIFTYLCLLTISIAFHIKKFRYIVVNLSAVFLSFALFEIWQFTMKDSHTFYGDYVTSGYQVSNPMIGYSARTLAKSYTSLRKKNGKTLYDVVYSIDKNGWRITPRSLNDTDAVVVFFGDSFTFGEGVDDKDTFAYQFSLKSSLKVYNFGYHGYGPHQMLRMLETGYIKHILEREGKAKSATLFVYTSLPAHVDRAAGRSSWDKNGPRYDLDSFGNAAFSGSFSSGALNPIIRILHTSELYQLINSLPQRLQLNNEAEDIARFAAIIKRSEKMVSETFAAKFVFIHWDCPYTSGNAARYADRISTEIGKNKNVLVHRITSSLPELCEPSNYIKEDGHPNSAGHGNYADFLLKELGYRSGNK